MDIVLSVPQFYQESESTDCGIVALQMILGSHRPQIDFKELATEANPWINDNERDSQGLVFVARNRGYQAHWGHCDLGVVSKELLSLRRISPLDIDTSLAKVTGDNEGASYRRRKLNLDKEIILRGGTLSYKFPSRSTIDHSLDRSIPIAVMVRWGVLALSSLSTGNHWLVVRGRRGNEYLVNDPLPESNGSYWIDADHLNYAWCVGSGYFLCVGQ